MLYCIFYNAIYAYAETKEEFDSINGIVGNLLIMYDQHFSICCRNGLGNALIVKFDPEFSKFFLAWIATVLKFRQQHQMENYCSNQ
jgi:hypothetical protein